MLLQIFITTHTDGDMSHFAKVGIFSWGLHMTDVGLWRLTLSVELKPQAMSEPHERELSYNLRMPNIYDQGIERTAQLSRTYFQNSMRE